MTQFHSPLKMTRCWGAALVCCGALACISVVPAYAAPLLSEDFESYSIGSQTGAAMSPWAITTPTDTTVEVLSHGGSKGLGFTDNSTSASSSITRDFAGAGTETSFAFDLSILQTNGELYAGNQMLFGVSETGGNVIFSIRFTSYGRYTLAYRKGGTTVAAPLTSGGIAGDDNPLLFTYDSIAGKLTLDINNGAHTKSWDDIDTGLTPGTIGIQSASTSSVTYAPAQTLLDNLVVENVPEPGSLGLLAVGALSILAGRKGNHGK